MSQDVSVRVRSSVPNKDIMVDSYCALVFFALVACAMAVFPLILNILLVTPQVSLAKNAPYECGFPALAHVRLPLDNRYYLVALLFVLFDIEIILLAPWAVVVRETGMMGWYTMMVFLGIVTLGFWYEWSVGALQWT